MCHMEKCIQFVQQLYYWWAPLQRWENWAIEKVLLPLARHLKLHLHRSGSAGQRYYHNDDAHDACLTVGTWATFPMSLMCTVLLCTVTQPRISQGQEQPITPSVTSSVSLLSAFPLNSANRLTSQIALFSLSFYLLIPKWTTGCLGWDRLGCRNSETISVASNNPGCFPSMLDAHQHCLGLSLP